MRAGHVLKIASIFPAINLTIHVKLEQKRETELLCPKGAARARLQVRLKQLVDRVFRGNVTLTSLPRPFNVT